MSCGSENEINESKKVLMQNKKITVGIFLNVFFKTMTKACNYA